MSQVIFRLAQIRLAANTGERLLDLLDELPSPELPVACRGANCGVCRVHVRYGGAALKPPHAAERALLARLEAEADERLACQLEVATAPHPDFEVGLERVQPG